MLRLPPSHIDLTKDDVLNLNRRLAARRTARPPNPSSSYVRLSPGPERQTSLSTVSADQNLNRKRLLSASSSSSEAPSDQDYDDEWIQRLRDGNLNRAPGQSAPVPRSLAVNVSAPHGSLPSSSAQGRQDDKITLRPPFANAAATRHASAQSSPHVLDGTLEQTPQNALTSVAGSVPVTRRGNTVLGGIQSDAYPIVHARHADVAEPSALSSSRARRRGIRNQPFPLHGHEPWRLETVDHAQNRQHLVVLGARNPTRPNQPPPELQLPDMNMPSDWTPSLDPGAPVFIPRTRFGSVVHTSPETASEWPLRSSLGSLNTTSHQSDLHARSSSEQNAGHPLPQRARRDPGNDTIYAVPPWHPPRHAIDSAARPFNQNTRTATQSSDLDRYALMRGSPRMTSYRAASNRLRQSTSHANDLRVASPSLIQLSQSPYLNHNQTDFHVYHVSIRNNDMPGAFAPRTRSASPAISAYSWSTPNLLTLPRSAPHARSRDGSWTWRRVASNATLSQRVPSTSSGLSGSAGHIQHSRHSDGELDAADEFLRRRNSPLDELTERFSRMRSVGRAWGRTPWQPRRVSLLSGDPFRQDPDPVSPIAAVTIQTEETLQADKDVEEQPTTEDLVALSLALPPSTPISARSEALPSSPPTQSNDKVHTRSPLAQLSPSKPATSPGQSDKPVSKAAVTPKVTIYDDNQPPNAQPQTPADVSRWRRAKNRSDTTSQRSPISVGRATVEGPPAIPERRVHRHTYPSGIAPASSQNELQVAAGPLSSTASLMTTAHHHQQPHHRRATRGHEQIENELDGQPPELEADRRTWLCRHEPGTMEVTPPKEGRFERYLT